MFLSSPVHVPDQAFEWNRMQQRSCTLWGPILWSWSLASYWKHAVIMSTPTVRIFMAAYSCRHMHSLQMWIIIFFLKVLLSCSSLGAHPSEALSDEGVWPAADDLLINCFLVAQWSKNHCTFMMDDRAICCPLRKFSLADWCLPITGHIDLIMVLFFLFFVFLFGKHLVGTGHEISGHALLEFGMHLHDPCGSLENWRHSDPTPCEWAGVTCSSDQLHILSM